MSSGSVSPLRLFLAQVPPEVLPLVQAARALILNEMPGLIEQLDESANLIGYGTDRTYKGLICGIMIYKNYINLMFARGARLPDPDDLLRTGKRACHIRIEQLADLAQPGARYLLEMAYLDGKDK
jgi:hypothetical protein